jgi:hypothetical protein
VPSVAPGLRRDAQDQRAIRVPTDSRPPWRSPFGRTPCVQICSRRFVFWFLWIRACPGANPAGALPRVQVCSRQTCLWASKTNSPGATIRPGAEWDERSAPGGQSPGKDFVHLDRQRRVRRTKPKGWPRCSRGQRVPTEGHPGLAGGAGSEALPGFCKRNSPAGRDPQSKNCRHRRPPCCTPRFTPLNRTSGKRSIHKAP